MDLLTMPANPAKGNHSRPRQYVRCNSSSFFPPLLHRRRPVYIRRDRKESNGYTFCLPDPGELPGAAVACSDRNEQIAVAAEACGAKVTPVNSIRGRGVILSQRIRGAGQGDHGTSGEIRCAPDLILAQRERADG